MAKIEQKWSRSQNFLFTFSIGTMDAFTQKPSLLIPKVWRRLQNRQFRAHVTITFFFHPTISISLEDARIISLIKWFYTHDSDQIIQLMNNSLASSQQCDCLSGKNKRVKSAAIFRYLLMSACDMAFISNIDFKHSLQPQYNAVYCWWERIDFMDLALNGIFSIYF